MKKELIMFSLIVSVLLCSLMVSAEEQTQEQTQEQEYGGIERVVDNVKLAFSGGDNKVRLALEVREKEVDSAINSVQNNNEEDALKNLERAEKKLQIIQEKVSLNTSEEIKTSVEEITNKINTNPALPEIFDDYLLEEQKTGLTAVLTKKTYEYCEELAKEDFTLMLKEKECNPETAIPGLEEELKKLKDLQYRMFVQLMLEIRSCIDDPGTCNCEANTDIREKAKCEKMVALAVKCEYKEDETSCDELEAMKPEPGDSFARSFVPGFLMNLFAEKYTMIEYGIEHSDGVPEECWDYNDKPECRQYDYLKETKEDWDEYGNYKPILYPGKHPSSGGIDERLPTIQEIFPECYNEEGMFLAECGNINIVLAKDGSVNYIVDKQIDNVIEEFENKSDQHLMEIRSGWMMVDNKWVIDKGQMGGENQTMDVNGTVPMEIRSGWMMVDNEWVVNPGYQDMKKGVNQIQNQIRDIVIVQDEMDIDMDKVDPDAGPKTPIPTDGSICCKKTKDGETRYHWDSEEECLDPGNIKGDVVDNDVCVALGSEVLDKEDPESWGSMEGGVPEPCVAQGAYDDEACERIMEMLEICCRRTIDGEVEYEWVPGKICVSPYGDRVDEDACLA